MSGTTFEKYGGFSTVSRIVMNFYELVLDSDDVGHFFDDIDMSRLIDHQTKFISSVMGGPESINDERLRRVHQKIDISDQDFNVVVSILTGALRSHGISETDIAQIGRMIETKRGLIVSHEQA